MYIISLSSGPSQGYGNVHKDSVRMVDSEHFNDETDWQWNPAICFCKQLGFYSSPCCWQVQDDSQVVEMVQVMCLLSPAVWYTSKST